MTPASLSTRKPRRLLFAPDLHGSTVAFRKLRDAPARHAVHALVCAGDITGERLAPIVKIGAGRHALYDGATRLELDGHAALAEARTALEAGGGYPITVSAEEHQSIASDPAAGQTLLARAVRVRLEESIALAEDRLHGTGVPFYITGGNMTPMCWRRSEPPAATS